MANYFKISKKIANCGYIPELGISFLRNMVMNPKNLPDNHWVSILVSNNHPIM
jgi:hypothetical protein